MVLGFGSNLMIKVQFSQDDLRTLGDLVDKIAQELYSQNAAIVFAKYPNLRSIRSLLTSLVHRSMEEINGIKPDKSYAISQWETMFQNINQLTQFISRRIIVGNASAEYYRDLNALLLTTYNLASYFDIILRKAIMQESKFMRDLYEFDKVTRETQVVIRKNIRRVA